MQISVSTPFYSTLTCRSVYLHLTSILHSVLHVDQCIYTLLCYTLLHVDQCIYRVLCYTVTYWSVYLHLSILYSVLHVDQCIYTFLYFTLCYILISVSTALYTTLCVTCTVHSKCINDHTLRSDIFLPKCPTHSREMSDKFESQHSLNPTIWLDIVVVVGRESGYLKIFFTFLEVNMSNILWSMRICKRTFFPVCRMYGT
jgi:hypothetical protein